MRHSIAWNNEFRKAAVYLDRALFCFESIEHLAGYGAIYKDPATVGRCVGKYHKMVSEVLAEMLRDWADAIRRAS